MTREDIFREAMKFAAHHQRPMTALAFAGLLTEFAMKILNRDKDAKHEQADAMNTARGRMKL